jgi:cytidylate kinase
VASDPKSGSAKVQHPPVVTIAALYGAGGTVIGQRVAERLGVPLLDRQIPEAVAKRTGLSEDAVGDVDEEPRSRLDQVAATLGRASTISGGIGGSVERLDLQERELRGHIEEFLARARVSGGVAIGRGGMVVLRFVEWALHVLLTGPQDARVKQRMALDGISRTTAEQRRKVEDRTRISYVRRAYGVDGEDASLYHMVLDSTALDLDTCVELIVAASQGRVRNPRAARPIED